MGMFEWLRWFTLCGMFGWLTAASGAVILAGSAGLTQGPDAWDACLLKLGPDSLTAPELRLLPQTGADAAANIRRLELLGIIGKSYATEWSDDLKRWQALATNTAASTSVEIVDALPQGTERYYRARILK